MTTRRGGVDCLQRRTSLNKQVDVCSLDVNEIEKENKDKDRLAKLLYWAMTQYTRNS